MACNSKSPSPSDYQRITNGFNGAGEMILLAKLNVLTGGKTILAVRKFRNTSNSRNSSHGHRYYSAVLTLIRDEISSKMFNENFSSSFRDSAKI